MNYKFNLVFLLLVWCLPTMLKAQDSFIVHILADDEYPPYSYVENGKLTGIYVELVKKAALLLKPTYHIKLVPMPWRRALALIENGEAFAILPPYKHLELRPYIFPYSIPLFEEHVVVYCHRRFNLTAFFNNETKKRPVNLGINSGYMILNDKYLAAVDDNRIILRENKSTSANIKKLIKGRIDCYVNDKLTIEQGLKAERPTTSIYKLFTKKDEISTQTAHIGYSNVGQGNFPFKNDFVDKMNKAIATVKVQYPIEHIIKSVNNESSHSNGL